MNKVVIALIAAAILGGLITLGAVITDEGGSPLAAPAPADVKEATDTQIGASGLVEASTGTIAVGTPVAGIVSQMDVQWGERVTKGTPLFRIDARDIANTRPTAVAELAKAKAALAPAGRNLAAAKRLHADGFLTNQDLIQREADETSAKAAIQTARAQIGRIDAEIARRTVRAPITGRILKINVRPGELADTRDTAPPVILMGNEDRLNVRAEIDEHDAWRLKPGMSATAYVPGNHALHTPLSFVRIEPYIQPKTNLTGGATERTDTRVLQVIYSFDPATLPVYIGQQLDVLIDARTPSSAVTRPVS